MYYIIVVESFGEFKDWGSKFLVYVFLVESKFEIEDVQEKVCKMYFKVCYYCYVYCFGFDGNNFWVNDDGEFSGIAGCFIFG